MDLTNKLKTGAKGLLAAAVISSPLYLASCSNLDVVSDNEQSIVNENFENSTAIYPGKFYFFAANYWKDFNKDGMPSPNEFVGIKKIFKDGEELILVSYDGRSGLKGDKKELKVYSPKGNIVYTNEDTYDYSREAFYYHGNKSTESSEKINTKVGKTIRGTLKNGTPFTDFLVKKGGYGNYKAVWTLNGKYDGSNGFEIIPFFKNKNTVEKIPSFKNGN